MKKILFLFILVSLFSCRSKQAVSDVRNYSEIKHDKLTAVSVPGDSSTLNALFRCDSLNNVLLVGFREEKSKNIQSSFDFKDNTFTYKAETKPDTVFLKSTDTVIREKNTKMLTITKTITNTKNIPVPVRGFFWYLGLLFTIYISIFTIIKIKNKFNVWQQLTKA